MATGEAIGQMGGIAWGIILNILYIVAGVALCIALYFLTKWVMKNTKKQKAFTIEALIYDLNGMVDKDMLAFIKSDVHGMYEMQFKTRKQDTLPPIPKHLIKNNKVPLLNYAPGHYCVLDTTEMAKQLEITGRLKIIPYNLHMKQYIKAKQRDALNKSEDRKKWWNTWLPWLTIGFAILVACVAIVLMFIFGGKQQALNAANRLVECKLATGR
jgi:uncharacterized membrane protein